MNETVVPLLPVSPGSRIRVFRYGNSPHAHPITNLDEISEVLADPASFVWLDAVDPQQSDLAVIANEFPLHPLAIEDALREHPRPKIEAYDGAWFVVAHGATRVGDALEIHEVAVFAGAKFIVTVRMSPVYPFDELERRWEHLPANIKRDSGALLYTILDNIVDGYTAIAEAIEERVEALESALLGDVRRTNDVLLQIYAMRKNIGRFRNAVLPMRDVLAPILRGDQQLFGADELPYYRDILDHVSLVIDQMENARDQVNNARDTHISIATHSQNEVAKQLTVVATVFLPLTFITGFFGQNFGWLVNHIASAQAFGGWGIGSEIAALAALVAYFRFKRWL